MNHVVNESSHMGHSLGKSDKLARGLGWFSIGLGLCELLAPGKVTHFLGMQGKEKLVRACGVREIASGIGALTENPTPAIWSRVGGDALSLAMLASALRDKDNYKKENVGVAIGLVVGATAVDLYCAQALTKRHAYQAGPTPDYSNRSGFSRPVETMRGAAAHDFETPADMRAALPSPARSPGERMPPTTRTNPIG